MIDRHSKANIVLMAGMLLVTAGCFTARQVTLPYPDDMTWTTFIRVADALEWSNADNGRGFYSAIETLGLTNCWIHGPVLIAQKDRHQSSRKPIPKVWEADAQVLIAAGDVRGDGQPKYSLAAGWWGPMAGILAVYDTHLKKLAELKMESILGIELHDITGDGADEILCWEDEHHGSGLWTRWLTIVKYIDGKGLVVVWRGPTYDERCKYLTKYDIWFEQKADVPTRIWSRHTYEQFPEPGDRNGKRELVKRYPNKLSSYVWNSAISRFEEDEAKISEPLNPQYLSLPR